MQSTTGNTGLAEAPGPFASIVDPQRDAHVNGDYLRNNPTWHVEHSPWKAQNLWRMLNRHNLQPRTVCDVGCGVGEVLRQLQLRMDPACCFRGYDIAAAAISMAKSRENERLKFELADFAAVETPRFDLLVMTEVVDHIEDYFRFLRLLRDRAEWKLFSFSLDFSAESSMRPEVLSHWRGSLSHLHHFNQPIVMDLLRSTGYDVVDYCYAPWSYRPLHFATRLLRMSRRLVFAMNPDLAARIFIGFNLIVLAR